MANYPSGTGVPTESKEGFAQPVSYKGYVPGTFGVSMSKGAPEKPAIVGIPKVGVEIKNLDTERRNKLAKAVEEAGFGLETGENGEGKLVVPEDFLKAFTEPYEQELALNEAMKNVQLAAMRRTIALASKLATLQAAAFEVSSAESALRPELDGRISKLKKLLDEAAAEGNVDMTNELEKGVGELENYLKLVSAPSSGAKLVPAPDIMPAAVSTALPIPAPIAVPATISTPVSAVVPGPAPTPAPTPTISSSPKATLRPASSPAPRPTPTSAAVSVPAPITAPNPVKGPEATLKVETLVPEQFETGQYFLVPADEESSEARWKVTHVSLEGWVTLRQIDGTFKTSKGEPLPASDTERSREETFQSKQLKEILGDIQLERQRTEWEKARKEREKSGVLPEEKKKVLRPVKKGRGETAPTESSYKAAEKPGFLKTAEDLIRERAARIEAENPGFLKASNVMQTEQKADTATYTIPTSAAAPEIAPQAVLKEQLSQEPYFTAGHFITITRGGQEPEQYRIFKTQDRKVTIVSIDHREKGQEVIDEDELKKIATVEKYEKAERPSYAPLKDLFTMFGKNNGYSVRGFLSWKKKWLDSGEIDTYRKNYTNQSISDEQIEDAKKAIQLYSEVLQTEGVSGKLTEDARINIVLNARLLTGVHHPEANNIEYYVQNKILNGEHLDVVRAALDKARGEKNVQTPEQKVEPASASPVTPATVPSWQQREEGEDWSYVDMAEGRIPTGETLATPVATQAGATSAETVSQASLGATAQPLDVQSPSSVSPDSSPRAPARQEKMRILEKVNKLLTTRMNKIQQTNNGKPVKMWRALAVPIIFLGSIVLYEEAHKNQGASVVPPMVSAPRVPTMNYTNWRAYMNTTKETEMRLANDIIRLSRQELAEKYVPSYVKKGDTLAAGKLFAMENTDQILSPNVEHVPGLTDEQRGEIHTFIATAQKVGQSMLAASQEKMKQEHKVYALEGVTREVPMKRPLGDYIDSIQKAESVLQS